MYVVMYTFDNITIGPDVCLSDERDIHAVKRSTFILKFVYD